MKPWNKANIRRSRRDLTRLSVVHCTLRWVCVSHVCSTLSFSEPLMESRNVVPFFESVDGILWRVHSNKTFLPNNITWYHMLFNILQNEILGFFLSLFFGTLGSQRIKPNPIVTRRARPRI